MILRQPQPTWNPSNYVRIKHNVWHRAKMTWPKNEQGSNNREEDAQTPMFMP